MYFLDSGFITFAPTESYVLPHRVHTLFQVITHEMNRSERGFLESGLKLWDPMTCLYTS